MTKTGDGVSLGVFLAVLGAAFLHALWNALIKLGTSKVGTMVILSVVEVPIGLAVVAVTPPINPAAIASSSTSRVARWTYGREKGSGSNSIKACLSSSSLGRPRLDAGTGVSTEWESVSKTYRMGSDPAKRPVFRPVPLRHLPRGQNLDLFDLGVQGRGRGDSGGDVGRHRPALARWLL